MGSKLISSLFRLILLGFLTFFVFFSDWMKVKFNYPYNEVFDNVYIRIARGCLLILVVVELVRMYYYGIVKNKKAPRLLSNLVTLALPVVLLLVFLEIAFMFVAQSHEGGLTLASHIWFERYWPPMTPEGYRDSEKIDTAGKQKVLVVGDSFTAGHGIKSAEDRYGNVLADKLGKDKYVVYNLGLSGLDTKEEYKRLETFPVKPDILILQYFPNDIEKAARDNGLTLEGFEPYTDLPKPVQTLFVRSYLLNFIYWQLPHGKASSYLSYVRTAYTKPEIINAHLNDLNQIMAYARLHNAKMYLVLFPFSHNLEKTTEYTQPVVDFFQKNNVPVLKVADLVRNIDPDDRIVGRNDAHASALVNRRVGEALFQLVASGGKTKGAGAAPLASSK
ncbi:hypothetical protein GCM10023187_31090 [Nibrella viscosa]|uniref:SGNH/GDSL hydrolase family protein n=1 Tax=Nibrella viscosa TaxID=1084524 RepID=A0ABP8KKM7_9BACT